jgi:hypothetical protein
MDGVDLFYELHLVGLGYFVRVDGRTDRRKEDAILIDPPGRDVKGPKKL